MAHVKVEYENGIIGDFTLQENVPVVLSGVKAKIRLLDIYYRSSDVDLKVTKSK